MKINSKILAITAAFLLFCTLHGAESEYGKNMQSYSCMMRIAKIIAEGEGVFRIDSYSLVYEKGKPAWDTDIETILGDAKKNKINSQRIDIVNAILKDIVGQAGKRFEDMDNVVDRITDLALRNKDDLVYAITAYNALDYFLNRHQGMFTGPEGKKYRKRAKANLKDSEEKVVDIVKQRYEDDTLKNFVDEYRKLFPREKMLLDNTPPADIKEVKALLNTCLDSFFALDKVSSMTDFRKWGHHMLNVMILDSNPILVEEYRQQLKNYRNTFK